MRLRLVLEASLRSAAPSRGGTTFAPRFPVVVMGLDQSPMIVSEEAASLLREYVAGERGQKLRTQLVSRHPNRSIEEIEEAIQTACKCFLEEAEGIEAPGQVYTWIRTAAHHALNREEEYRGWVDPADPTGEDLSTASGEEAGPEQEVIANEEESELAELVREVAECLPERKRDVLALYGAGYKRPQIASRLGMSRRRVKRDLLEIMDRARGVLAHRVGGGCEHGEPLVMRLACGLATPSESEQARRHLSRCGQCEHFNERLAAWREKVPAALPFPAADQANPGVLERAAHKVAEGADALKQQIFDGGTQLKQYAATGYYRVVDPTPFAAARPGTVAAVVAGCITLGGGAATYCVERGVDPMGAARGLIVASEESEQQPEEPPPEPAETPPPPIELPVEEEAPVAEEAPPPVEVEEPAPEPPPPPPPPEQSFEPSSPEYSATEASASEATSTASNSEPAPVPAGSSPEFGGP